MTYTPADVPGFMGLDLADVEDARGAIEATDCYVHPDGRLIPRGGYTVSGSVTGTTITTPATGSLAFQAYATGPSPTVYPSATLYPSGVAGGSSSTLVVSGHSNAVQTWDSTGTRLALLSTTSPSRWSFAALAGSAWGANSGNTVIQATVTGITQPQCSTRASTAQVGVFTGSRDMPKPTWVGVQTPDNRLVAAGFTTPTGGPNGTPTTAATIFFSQPDDPTKWDETEFEIVGDAGEPIIGLANWGDYLIVFKEREWFVFYGNSVRTDGTGLAVFNYRRVTAGCAVRSWVTGSKSIYLMDSQGNLRATTGGSPQIVFNGDDEQYSPVTAQGFRAGSFIGFPVTKGATSGYLVMDEDNGRVFFWSLGLPAGTSWGNLAYFPRSTGLASFPNGATDNGTTVTASYASAYSSWGQAGIEKSVRQTMFHGTGTITVSWAKDLQSYGFPRSVTMRAGRGIDRNAVRGETLSYKLTGSGFTLNRLVPMLREQRPSGVRA